MPNVVRLELDFMCSVFFASILFLKVLVTEALYLGTVFTITNNDNVIYDYFSISI